MKIQVNKFYFVSTITEPVEVIADHGDGSYTVRAFNIYNEPVCWSEESSSFYEEAEPVAERPLVPRVDIPVELINCTKPMVLGCFIAWSKEADAWQVISCKTGESVWVGTNGDASVSDGIKPEKAQRAIAHARRCLDLIKAVV